ncbi:hypothetical protein AHMF7605_29015 [Adhaeribacter arboris]|uniref:C-type lysozyme inhibitor domain-containing protein n=1 Tax=Adhaeribacter arboris TaxID=2072846 RepID=A0A2T2Y8X5_9BACT|nr:MliC family protein [Adhaeribacter arboris]PSR51953.1 hypothetical protein AHMF7605_29015 [Adhaeribacter arboris]
MKKLINQVGFIVLLSMSLFSCNTHSSQKAGSLVQPPLLEGTLKSATGEELRYSFNNVIHTLIIQYQGATSTLTAQPTGSGIKYANEEYVYSEWQGKSTLQKNGKIIFEASTNSGKQK